jgi:hypothetical protein
VRSKLSKAKCKPCSAELRRKTGTLRA